MPGAGVTVQKAVRQLMVRGIKEPRAKACRSHLTQKTHSALSKPGSFGPPGGGIRERCPVCHTLHRVWVSVLAQPAGPRERGDVGEPRGCRARSQLCSRSPCTEGCTLPGREAALELPAGITGPGPSIAAELGGWHRKMEKLSRSVQMKSWRKVSGCRNSG